MNLYPWRRNHHNRQPGGGRKCLEEHTPQLLEKLESWADPDTVTQKEHICDFKNVGREWQPKGEPAKVRVHDVVVDRELWKAIIEKVNHGAIEHLTTFFLEGVFLFYFGCAIAINSLSSLCLIAFLFWCLRLYSEMSDFDECILLN